MPAASPVTLHTKRLLLRPCSPDDVDEGQRFRDDEEFARFLPHIPIPFTRADAEKWVTENMKGPWDQYPTFVIEFEGRLIGDITLEIDADKRTAMIGYSISRAHWGKGITSEAGRAVIAWGFETFGLTEVWASTDARHARSRRVMEKLGMQYDRTVPNHHLDRNGEPVEEVVYVLTRQRWQKSAGT